MTHHAVNDLPVDEHDEARNAAHLISSGKLFLAVDIHLAYRISQAGQLLDDWSHLLTRSTPIGREIQQNSFAGRLGWTGQSDQ